MFWRTIIESQLRWKGDGGKGGEERVMSNEHVQLAGAHYARACARAASIWLTRSGVGEAIYIPMCRHACTYIDEQNSHFSLNT